MHDTLPTAKLPTSYAALLYVVSLFCPPKWQHSERRRYADTEMNLEGGIDRTQDLIDLLRQAWSQEDSSRLWGDAFEEVYKQMRSLDALELHTRTYAATPQQTLWVLLGFDVMPTLGRSWGFWSQDEALVPQMPSDDLWFLPQPDPTRPDRLILPVETVVSWWLEQIDGPLDLLWGGYDDDRRRTIDNWKSGRTTPTSAKIAEWFGDDVTFPYQSSVESLLSTRQLRSLLLWARALEQGYKDLVRYLTPDVAPDDADPNRNKALQLIELFRWSHEATVATDPTNPVLADHAFVESLPSWVKDGPFHVITPDLLGALPVAEHMADFLSGILSSVPSSGMLRDIFEDLTLRSPSVSTFNGGLVEHRLRVQGAIDACIEMRQSSDPHRQFHVAAGLAKLQCIPGINEFEADLAYLSALNALSSGNFEDARQQAEKALELCLQRSIGPLKLAIAKLNFSLAVAQDAFNRGSAERSYRILCKSFQRQDADRWRIDLPIDHSMRLAAADHADWFWNEVVCPYEGVEMVGPLTENSEIIRAHVDLLWSGASEDDLRQFVKRFRGKLKRKLRNVRGDTLFTAMSKLVPEVVSTMREMPTSDGSLRTPSELAESMTETHLKLVSLLPTDVLNARDYLKQTALMLATERNDVDMVSALVNRNVDVDAQDSLGRTALHAAAKVGSNRCFEILLAAGANPTLRTYEGKTPAIFAAEFGRATIFEMRLACTAYRMSQEELANAHELATVSAQCFKAKRKYYADEGYEIAGKRGFQRIAELASLKLCE